VNRLATVSAIDHRRAHAFLGEARQDGERRFAVARRHSRHVRLLRVGIPVAIAGGCALMLLLNYLNPMRLFAKLPVQVGHMVVSGTKITMEAPRLAGVTRDARAYEMTAQSAAQDITRPDKLELQGVRAKFETPDRALVNVTAASGLYDTKDDMLRLNKDVLITSTSGYEVVMTEAVIDIRTNHVVSDKPVAVKMISGNINANALEVTDSGDTIRFTGGVTMTITSPPTLHAETAAEAP
jgi:lipopolysaccharide export system protein LptC